MEQERRWLIRTASSMEIRGPLRRSKALELLDGGGLGEDDEFASENGFWFRVKETDLVERHLRGDEPQGFDPVAGVPSVLTDGGTGRVLAGSAAESNTMVQSLGDASVPSGDGSPAGSPSGDGPPPLPSALGAGTGAPPAPPAPLAPPPPPGALPVTAPDGSFLDVPGGVPVGAHAVAAQAGAAMEETAVGTVRRRPSRRRRALRWLVLYVLVPVLVVLASLLALWLVEGEGVNLDLRG